MDIVTALRNGIGLLIMNLLQANQFLMQTGSVGVVWRSKRIYGVSSTAYLFKRIPRLRIIQSL